MNARNKALYRESARICLAAPMLFGVDHWPSGTTMEQMVLRGLQRRYRFVFVGLKHGRILPEALEELVMGRGMHGSDRLTAVWWFALNEDVAAAFEDDCDTLLPAMASAKLADLLDRPVETLVQEQILSWVAHDVLVGTNDPFFTSRRLARQETSAFMEKLQHAAQMEVKP